MIHHKHSADDPLNYVGSLLPHPNRRAQLFTVAALNTGGLNLQNFELAPPRDKSEPESPVLPLHQFEEVMETMGTQNFNALCLADIRTPPNFQANFNKNRRSYQASFTRNEATLPASCGLISAKHHGAISGTATKLDGRLIIHTYTTGKSARPHGFRRISVLAVYVPQKDAPPNPSDPPQDPKGPRLDQREVFLDKVADLVNRLRGLGHLIIMAGDLNLAPDPLRLDRSSGAPNGQEERIFNSFLAKAQLADAFREMHPQLKAYSYYSTRNTQSRIDHVLVDRKIIPTIAGARIAIHPSFNKPTELDHRMVIVDFHLHALFGALPDIMITPQFTAPKPFAHMQTNKMNPTQLQQIQQLTLLSAAKFAKLEREWEHFHEEPPSDKDFLSKMEEDWTATLLEALDELKPPPPPPPVTMKPRSLRSQLTPPSRRRGPRTIEDLLLRSLQNLARLWKHNPPDHPPTWKFLELSVLSFKDLPPPPHPPSLL